MSARIIQFPRGVQYPQDRELAVRLVQEMRAAKDRAYQTGEPEIIDHDGMEVALIEVDDLEVNEMGDPVRTVFVRLTKHGRTLLPIPWNV